MRFDIGRDFHDKGFDVPQFPGHDSIAQIDMLALMNQKIAEADHRNVATGILNHHKLFKPLHDRSRSLRRKPPGESNIDPRFAEDLQCLFNDLLSPQSLANSS